MSKCYLHPAVIDVLARGKHRQRGASENAIRSTCVKERAPFEATRAKTVLHSGSGSSYPVGLGQRGGVCNLSQSTPARICGNPFTSAQNILWGIRKLNLV